MPASRNALIVPCPFMRWYIRPVAANNAQASARVNARRKRTPFERTLLRGKPAHHALTVGLSRPQNALREIGVIHEIRKKLRLKAEAAVPFVNGAVLALDRALQEITGIKLHTQLVAQHFQHPATDGFMHASGEGEASAATVQHEIIVVTGRITFELLKTG